MSLLSFYHPGQNRLEPGFQRRLEGLGVPLGITSGYRSPQHPVEARKKRGPGMHAHGKAVDIDIKGKSEEEVDALIRDLVGAGVRRIGLYSDMDIIHADMSEDQGPVHFMYDKTSRNMGQAPAFYQKTAAELSGGDYTIPASALTGDPSVYGGATVPVSAQGGGMNGATPPPGFTPNPQVLAGTLPPMQPMQPTIPMYLGAFGDLFQPPQYRTGMLQAVQELQNPAAQNQMLQQQMRNALYSRQLDMEQARLMGHSQPSWYQQQQAAHWAGQRGLRAQENALELQKLQQQGQEVGEPDLYEVRDAKGDIVKQFVYRPGEPVPETPPGGSIHPSTVYKAPPQAQKADKKKIAAEQVLGNLATLKQDIQANPWSVGMTSGLRGGIGRVLGSIADDLEGMGAAPGLVQWVRGVASGTGAEKIAEIDFRLMNAVTDTAHYIINKGDPRMSNTDIQGAQKIMQDDKIFKSSTTTLAALNALESIVQQATGRSTRTPTFGAPSLPPGAGNVSAGAGGATIEEIID